MNSDNTRFIHRKGFMFVLSSPSGAGKTTLSRMLLERDSNLVMSISATTRAKREKETNGVDYHFVSEEEFDAMRNKNAFLEHAKVFSHFYGTPKELVNAHLDKGVDVLFDIDWQGTEQLTDKCRDDVVSIFILPPSMQELEKRLRSRGQDSEDVIQSRMDKASNEISHWDAYDYVLVNDDLDKSLEAIASILQAERNKRRRQDGLKDFVSSLLA